MAARTEVVSPAWEEAIEGCLGYLATEKSHAVRSQMINRTALESFGAWMQRRHPAINPAGLTVPLLREFLRDRRGLAPASMKVIIVALRHLFAHLRREGTVLRDFSSALDLPRPGRHLPATLNEEEVTRLLAVELPDSPLGLRDRSWRFFMPAACARRKSPRFASNIFSRKKACCGSWARATANVLCPSVSER
jgi:integrase/recombinase XerD